MMLIGGLVSLKITVAINVSYLATLKILKLVQTRGRGKERAVEKQVLIVGGLSQFTQSTAMTLNDSQLDLVCCSLECEWALTLKINSAVSESFLFLFRQVLNGYRHSRDFTDN
jgi:hypothetical protein